MARTDLSDLDNEAALLVIGHLVDLSDTPEGEDGTAKALAWGDELALRDISEADRALLDYFRANAWHNRQRRRPTGLADELAWQQPEQGEQVLLLRSALNSAGFQQLIPQRQCEVLTNLGSQLSGLGRSVEALEYWDRALAINPNFWMAQGSRGHAELYYAKNYYDRRAQAIMLYVAHQHLVAADQSAQRFPHLGYHEARAGFSSLRMEIEYAADVERIARNLERERPLSHRSKAAREYREWCLAHRLILNPLNDFGVRAMTEADELVLPGFVSTSNDPPAVIGLFNQIKQEFVSSRWLYYEGTRGDGPHHSDRYTNLSNTLDYPAYGLAVEKVRLAFRSAYSIFDKIAYFLNAYFGLGVKLTQIDFRRIWTDKTGQLHPQFDQSENWPLRGLYWLSKDFFEDGFRDLTEPDAQALHTIRNHLEHKFLKVHELMLPGHTCPEGLAYSISRDEFEAKTLRLIKLARAGIIYLTLAMHREERRRAERAGDGLTMPLPLTSLPDRFKR